jgi:hypothetical protein
MTSSLQNGEYYDFKIGQLNSLRCIPGGTAITSYLGYFDTDFGPNYIRNLELMIILVENFFNGSGNDFPMMGTGNTVFFNWVTCSRKFFRRSIANKISTIAIQYSDFEE